MVRYNRVPGFVPVLLGLLIVTPLSLLYAQGSAGGVRIIEQGQPPVVIHATVEDANRARAANAASGHAGAGVVFSSASSELSYHGGAVETTPKIYLVLWGSQWSSDPSSESAILQSFYNGVGGSSWLNSVTQYCQGVASGTVFCVGGMAADAGNPAGILAGVWSDNGSAAPTHPKQSQLAAEAVKAAGHFGNTTAASNASVQYVIATAHGNNSSAFGAQYCAWHSSTSSTAGNVAYTNLPYITDAGASCGANFNGLGSKAGITIVGGHELGETVTDQFPSSGWTDSGGAENGDKCAWISSGQGAAARVTLSNGLSFPVQSLWSNALNSDAGGCVLSYP